MSGGEPAPGPRDGAADHSTLVRLLGRHFHRGWSRESDEPDEVLAALVRATPSDRLNAAARELDLLLGRGLCEPQLRDVLLYEIGCHFDPQSRGSDASTWLRHVLDHFLAEDGP